MYYVAQTTRINGKTVIWRPPPPSTQTLFALGQPAGRASYDDELIPRTISLPDI